MDPTLAVNLGLTVLDTVLSEIAKLKAQYGLTGDQLSDMADQQDLENLVQIKGLLNPPTQA